MKKIFVILFVLALSVCFGVTAMADATALPTVKADEATSKEDPTQAEENATASQESTTVPSENGTGEENENPFVALYELVRSHTAEIFSALAALLSCVIAFAYRRGLIPLVKQGIGSRASTVGGINKATEAARQQMLDEAQSNRDRTDEMQNSIRLLSHEVSEVLSRFDALKQSEAERALLLSTLEAEVDLLGEIFLSSSLPEYRKEIVGSTVARLKEQLAAGREA